LPIFKNWLHMFNLFLSSSRNPAMFIRFHVTFMVLPVGCCFSQERRRRAGRRDQVQTWPMPQLPLRGTEDAAATAATAWAGSAAAVWDGRRNWGLGDRAATSTAVARDGWRSHRCRHYSGGSSTALWEPKLRLCPTAAPPQLPLPYISNPGNIATSAILLFGNDLNAKLDREPQVQGADFRDLEFGVCSKHSLRV
jgi:hypothetical protein